MRRVTMGGPDTHLVSPENHLDLSRLSQTTSQQLPSLFHRSQRDLHAGDRGWGCHRCCVRRGPSCAISVPSIGTPNRLKYHSFRVFFSTVPGTPGVPSGCRQLRGIVRICDRSSLTLRPRCRILLDWHTGAAEVDASVTRDAVVGLPRRSAPSPPRRPARGLVRRKGKSGGERQRIGQSNPAQSLSR
jgi:hypothetical protein